MATLTATRAASTFPAFQATGSGTLCAAYGSYDLSANPSVNDVIKLCKVPAGAVVLGGGLRMEDLDTNGSPTIDIDLGWAVNGGSGTSDAADPDGFGNFSVANGTAVTHYTPEGGSIFPLAGTLKDGPVTFTRETTIQAVVNAVAATFAAGTVTAVVLYVVP